VRENCAKRTGHRNKSCTKVTSPIFLQIAGGDTVKQVGEDDIIINKDKISPQDEDEGIRDSPYANAIERSQYDGGVDAEAG
jgi:hypothetical protein